jgi:hypothetical protein
MLTCRFVGCPLSVPACENPLLAGFLVERPGRQCRLKYSEFGAPCPEFSPTLSLSHHHYQGEYDPIKFYMPIQVNCFVILGVLGS